MSKTVLITGASRGIGRELALMFARNGYDVIIHGRNRGRLKNLQRQIAGLGGKCYVTAGDITNTATIRKLYGAAKKHNISVLINNAGISGDGLVGRITMRQIDKVVQTNLIAPMKLVNKIYPFFLKRRSGTIINMNSVAGLEFQVARPVYCASKWGFRGFSGALRSEAVRHGIRIIDVFPSRVKTLPEVAFGMDPTELAEKIYRFLIKSRSTILVVDNRPKKYRHYV